MAQDAVLLPHLQRCCSLLVCRYSVAIMVDTEGSEVHTNELKEPIKAEVRAVIPSFMRPGAAMAHHVSREAPADCIEAPACRWATSTPSRSGTRRRLTASPSKSATTRSWTMSRSALLPTLSRCSQFHRVGWLPTSAHCPRKQWQVATHQADIYMQSRSHCLDLVIVSTSIAAWHGNVGSWLPEGH